MTESKITVLVVDDERNIRKNLSMVLEAQGYKVDTASNGDYVPPAVTEAISACVPLES